jgi:hypothetical protein
VAVVSIAPENRLAYDLDDQDADRLMTYPWIRA